MQAHTAAPRDELDVDDVLRLLQSDSAVEWSAGLELLAADLAVVSDLSDELVGGSIERSMYRVPHGSCKLQLTTALRWGLDLVRPYVVLSTPTLSARWNAGVYVLTTPESTSGEDVPTYDVQGWDRLQLLQREVGDSYEVAAGTTYLAAVRQVISDAGLVGVNLDSSAGTTALPTTRSWPLLQSGDEGTGPTTWLRIVNDLLDAINYRGVYADENGLLRSEPYVAPSARAVEHRFADDAATILGETRTTIADVWAVPNRWRFVRTNVPGDPPPEPTEGAGLYTYDLPGSHPLSATSRGLVWARTVELEVASQADLQTRGDRIVASDLSVTTTYKLETGPWPGAGHADVYELAIGDDVQRVRAVEWSYDLDGGDVSWTWEAV